jgi:hypothetical protein
MCLLILHENIYINIPIEKDEDRIGPDGVESLFKDLAISPASVTALVLAWKLGAGIYSFI